MSSDTQPLVCIGHSQVRAVAQAAVERQVPLVAIDFWTVRNPIVDEGGQERFCDGIQRHLGAHPIFSLIGGNAHHKLGLVRPAKPFDFVLPSAPDLPLDPDAELLPCERVRAALDEINGIWLRYIQILRRTNDGPVFHVQPPPIYPVEGRVTLAIRGQVPGGRASGRVLRDKLWRLHCEMMTEFCARAGVGLIPVPPESMDANGYLRSEYYKDPMHTTVAYGALVLEQLRAVASHVSSTPAGEPSARRSGSLADVASVTILPPQSAGLQDATLAASTAASAAVADALCDDRQPSDLVKCVVWDLDNTLWDGVLVEQDEVVVRAPILEAIKTLDERGIVSSIASRGDRTLALAKLRALGIGEYFLCPQIAWDSKVAAIERIVDWLGISRSAVAFVDDQAFERGAVAHAMPDVLCLEPESLLEMLSSPRFCPPTVTEDARLRRHHYATDAQRRDARAAFHGTDEEFLHALEMQLAIAPATLGDVARLQELMARTHRLNSTGRKYSAEQLVALLASSNACVLAVRLADVYGSYGIVGAAVVAYGDDSWTIELLALSCRVMSRGIERAVLHELMQAARASVTCLRAEFIANSVNDLLRDAFLAAGFRAASSIDELTVLEHRLEDLPPCPAWVRVQYESDPSARERVSVALP